MQPSPFHLGEQAVQSRLGVREQIEPWARQVVVSALPEQHRDFHTALPFVIAAARDAEGRPWATMLAGDNGFISSPDAAHLRINATPSNGDALADSFTAGAELGLLGIELDTRRRNRVNGNVVQRDNGSVLFEVAQAFGNCPQYIHPRALRRVTAHSAPRARRSTTLSRHLIAWVEGADTFFIASGYRGDGDNAAFGMDASHRGGEAGFIKVTTPAQLVFPDYAGNNHFNTIGNLMVDPRAGLLFIDFATGSLLQMSGHTEIDWDSPALAEFPGARRLVYFNVEAIVEIDCAVPLRWEGAQGFMRTLRVIEKRRESEDVTSFVLAARDGGTLASFEPGQHLPIALDVPGQDHSVQRTYSLSGHPTADTYRISVKREKRGLASGYLHDHIETGAFIDAWAPAGDFHADATSQKPLVLISAGVGLTPMVSMLHAFADNGVGRRVWFFHGARDGGHHPLAGEVRALAHGRDDVNAYVTYSAPRPTDELGHGFDAEGRLDANTIKRLIGHLDADFYICGPTGFMATLRDDLAAIGAAAESIHSETFGPLG